MERSLKTWRVGNYQVQVVRNAYRVRGLGPLWGSYRAIPAPDLVMEILGEAFERQGPDPSDHELITWKKESFWRRFNRYREKFNPNLHIDPRGLRRTLLKEFFVRKRYCPALQLYRGHKPENISDIDWEHYLDRLEYDPNAVLKMFWEDVVEPLNEWLKPHREKWNSGRGKPVRLTS